MYIQSIYITQLLEIFTKDEILKNKLLNTRKIVFTISELLKFGFTKDEILKNRLFENLLYAITPDELIIFSRDELINYKIIDKCKNLPLGALINVGFSKKEILTKYSNVLDNITNSILNFFGKDATISIVVKKISGILWSGDWRRLGAESDSDRINVIITMFSLYDITSEEVPLRTIKENSKKPLITSFIYNTDISKNNVESLYRMGYEIQSKEDVSPFLGIFSIGDNNYPKLINLIETFRSVDDNSYLFLVNYLNNKLDMQINSSWGCGFKYYDVQKIISILKNNKELLDNIVHKFREILIKKPHEFRTKSENDSGWSGNISVNKTIEYLKFFKVKKEDFEKYPDGMQRLKNVFKDVSLSYCDEILEYLKSIGYKFSKTEIEKFVRDIASTNRNSGKTEIEEYLISKDISKDASYKKILSVMKELTKPEGYNNDKYKKLFAGTKYEEEYNNTIEMLKIREFIYEMAYDLEKVASPERYSTYHDEEKLKKWYDKYWEKGYLVYGLNSRYGSYGENNARLIALLTCLNKFDDLNKIKNLDFLKDGATFDNNLLHTLAKWICGIKTQNISLNPTEEQKKTLYEWIISKVDINDINIMRYLQVCFYIYDKEKFEEYFERVKNTKNNIKYKKHTRAGEEKITSETNRLLDLKYIMSYLATNKKWDELEDMILQIKNAKMGKIEMKKAKEVLSRLGIRDDRHGEVKNQLIKMSDEILKESFILRWSEFNSLDS